MEIRSISFPRQFTLELEASRRGRTRESTFRKRLDYNGGKYDNLGFDDGRRALPDAVASDSPLKHPNAAYPNQEAATRSAALSATAGNTATRTPCPRWASTLTHRQLAASWPGSKRFGYLLTAGYENGQRPPARPEPAQPHHAAADGSLQERNAYQVEIGADEVQLCGAGHRQPGPGHRPLDDRADAVQPERLGRDRRCGRGKHRGQRLPGEVAAAVPGPHVVVQPAVRRPPQPVRHPPAPALGGFHAYGERDEPDRRTVAYGDNGRRSAVAGAVRARASASTATSARTTWAATLSLRFPLWAEAWGTVGGLAAAVDRGTSATRRFRMIKNQQQRRRHGVPAAHRGAARRPDGIGTLTDIDARTTRRQRQLRVAADRSTPASCMLETPIFGRAVGDRRRARRDRSPRRWNRSSPFRRPAGRRSTKRTDRTDVDFLPGAALKYELSQGMLLRAAYGITVARPQIRELAPYQYYDFLRDRSVEGNPDLKRTLHPQRRPALGVVLRRGRRSPRPRPSTSVQAAHRADHPGQPSPAARSSGTPTAPGTWAPSSSCVSAWSGWRARCAGSYFESNLALVYSRIELPEMLARAVRASRPLAGQSPYVANLSLRFFEAHRGVTASLVYNVVGPRISRRRHAACGRRHPARHRGSGLSLARLRRQRPDEQTTQAEAQGQEPPAAAQGAEAGRLSDLANRSRDQRIAGPGLGF